MNTQDNYNIMIRKLDEFIRKFYINQLLRGILYTVAIVISMYLLFSLLEFKFYFTSGVRTFLFYGFIGVASFTLFSWVLKPLLRIYRLGKIIDYKTAAAIIGQHFSDIQDRLLNVLQLKDQSISSENLELVEAGINQKIEKIKPIRFSLAIDLRKNRKYLKYALPPLSILVFMLFAAPNVLKDSNLHLIKYNTFFERKAPFIFLIENKSLETVQYEDFELHLKISGEILPEQIAISTETGTYTMLKKDKDEFSYRFNKVPSDIDFHFNANGFHSKEYTISVVPKPTLLNFEVEMDYPEYTGIKDETSRNSGDLLVPEGTNLKWIYNTENTDKLEVYFSNQLLNAGKEGKSDYTVTRKAMTTEMYKIGISNSKVISGDTISYTISVIPDNYPEINVRQFKDSLDEKFLYFLGDIKDDYGVKNVNFKYSVESMDAGKEYYKKDDGSENIAIQPNSKTGQFTSSFDLRSKSLQPGDRVTYYFEVWDNDGVHGSKSSRTPAMQYVVPTIDELQQIKDQNNEDLKNKMDDLVNDIRDIQKQTDKLQEKFFDKKELNWEDKKSLENLVQKNQQVQQSVEQLKEDFKKNLEMQQEYLQPDPDILQKQEQLEKMFDEVLPDEMKQLMEELQELMDKMNKEQSLDEMKKMEMNNEQVKNELDRMLELFKQLEMQEKMQETIDKLNDLAKEQDDVNKETEDKKSDNTQNLEKQEDVNKKFDDVQKDLQEMREMNKDLEEQKDLENSEQQEQNIDQSLQNSSQQIKQNNKKQASQNQKNASQQMKQMAQQMQDQMQQQGEQQQEEDMNSLKRLLDNLIKLSVDQESLMDQVKEIKPSNPKFVELMAAQEKIREDTKIVEDSLMALAKRNFQIGSFITREMTDLKNNLNNSVEQMGDRQVAQSNLYQQSVMTGYNNLALMLDEVMQQMQQQMAKSKPGSQMCQKPGGTNESQLPSMSEMQKQLNEQLNKMKGEMEKGQKEGQKSGMSKELAEMAQKQAAIRDAIQKMMNELGGGNTEDGKLSKQLQQIADQMDKTEEDIVNKRLSEETLKRQQDILTRLLEAEESDRQRKQDNERKSETAKEITRTLPPAIEEYLNKRNAELDLYKTVSPELKPFYKNLVEDYLQSITY